MRRAPLVAALLALVPTGIAAEEKPIVDQKRTIAVTGRGEVKGTPDRVTISFAVETTAGRAGEAASENAKRSGAVAAALRSVLGADATITTTRYTIEPRYEPVRPGETREPHITGYVARNEVQVEGGAARAGRGDGLGDTAGHLRDRVTWRRPGSTPRASASSSTGATRASAASSSRGRSWAASPCCRTARTCRSRSTMRRRARSRRRRGAPARGRDSRAGSA